MIELKFLQSPHLKIAYRHRAGNGPTLILIHGNGSSSLFFNELINSLPVSWNIIAPDMRGYGDSEAIPIDATKGFQDPAEDLLFLMNVLQIDKAHLLGHSLGGGLLWYILAHHSDRLQSATFVNPASPYGFGGTKGIDGTACWADFAGSGGGHCKSRFCSTNQGRRPI